MSSFTAWDRAQSFLEAAEKDGEWVTREIAERSPNLVQPIPSAMLRDDRGKYLVLTRGQTSRSDMSGKLSLVIGGHIDLDDVPQASRSIEELAAFSLRRELKEELGLEMISELTPLGITIDRGSVHASRHVGLIHLVRSGAGIMVAEDDEFNTHAALAGSFVSPDQLERLRNAFDPWSRILVKESLVTQTKKPSWRGRGVPS